MEHELFLRMNVILNIGTIYPFKLITSVFNLYVPLCAMITLNLNTKIYFVITNRYSNQIMQHVNVNLELKYSSEIKENSPKSAIKEIMTYPVLNKSVTNFENNDQEGARSSCQEGNFKINKTINNHLDKVNDSEINFADSLFSSKISLNENIMQNSETLNQNIDDSLFNENLKTKQLFKSLVSSNNIKIEPSKKKMPGKDAKLFGNANTSMDKI